MALSRLEKAQTSRPDKISDPNRSGQVRFITRPKSRTMRAKRKTFESEQNEGAQMSSELESEGAIGAVIWRG